MKIIYRLSLKVLELFQHLRPRLLGFLSWGYDKHLAVIRRNLESPLGWPYYHNSVTDDGALTDIRGRVSALDMQDNLETNEKKGSRSFEMIGSFHQGNIWAHCLIYTTAKGVSFQRKTHSK